MAEILLVHLRVEKRSFGAMPPLGLAWIAAYLESKSVAVNPAESMDRRKGHDSDQAYPLTC